MTLPLFRPELEMVVLGSGSKGNATWIGDRGRGVLIDCGLSTRQILLRLEAAGRGDAPIDAVFITHEHSDHIGAARVLCNKLKKRTGRSVPFYMTAGTLAGSHPKCRPDAVETLRAGEGVRLGHVEVRSFPVPHDVRDPVAYQVGIDGTWAGVITDLGRPTALVAERLASLSAVVLEFNHCEQMLRDGPYPWHLKQRISSSHGHLSNRQAAALLSDALQRSPTPPRHIALAHLSEENNRPAHAHEACLGALEQAGCVDEVVVGVAHQGRPLAPIAVQARA